MEIQSQEKILLLGASSGLGKATLELLENQPQKPMIKSFSRKIGGMDFSKKDKWPQYVDVLLNQEKPQRLIYFSAGGPYGEYKKFEWKDHEWAFNVSFIFPAFLLHSALSIAGASRPKQIIFIGSAIAENKPDPRASMYCASKHALKGLISSVQLEEPQMDIRLYSPGYMDTPMLPANSWPRQKALGQNLVQKVDTVAQDLIQFMTQPDPNL